MKLKRAKIFFWLCAALCIFDILAAVVVAQFSVEAAQTLLASAALLAVGAGANLATWRLIEVETKRAEAARAPRDKVRALRPS